MIIFFQKDRVKLLRLCIIAFDIWIQPTKHTFVWLLMAVCGGQNKNTIMVAMCSFLLLNEAPSQVKQLKLIFPWLVIHKYLPPDRVFAQIEKKIGNAHFFIAVNSIVLILMFIVFLGKVTGVNYSAY